MALCLLTGVFAYAQPNLVSNPGFETVEDGEAVGWTNMSSTLTVEVATGVVHSGSNSLKVSSTSGSQHFVINFVPVTPGKTYNLSVWYNVEGHTGSTRSSISLAYTYIDADGNNLNAIGEIRGTIDIDQIGSSFFNAAVDDPKVVDLNTWRQLTCTTGEEAPANAAYIGFLLRPVQVTGYYDDASLTEVGGPVAKQEQTVTGLSDMTKTVGDADFELSATASSGLPVTYSSANMNVATIVDGNRVHIVGAGSSQIIAAQLGNEEYESAQQIVTLTVNDAPVPRQNQTITGLSEMTKTAGDADFELSATASSGLPVTYTSSDPSIATISGSTVHIVSAGSTIITAHQSGNETYNPAPDVSATLTVNPAPKQNQTITGLSDITKTVGDDDFELSATASSGLSVSYASSNPSVATISGSTVHIVGAGTTTITASQAGNDAYNPAPDVTATLTVNVGGAGIDEVKVQLPVRIVNGNLTVTAAPGSRIEVFSVVGSRLQSVTSSGGETVLAGLPKGQVLIVRSGHAVAKVIL
jgi:hypothetical protein